MAIFGVVLFDKVDPACSCGVFYTKNLAGEWNCSPSIKSSGSLSTVGCNAQSVVDRTIFSHPVVDKLLGSIAGNILNARFSYLTRHEINTKEAHVQPWNEQSESSMSAFYIGNLCLFNPLLLGCFKDLFLFPFGFYCILSPRLISSD